MEHMFKEIDNNLLSTNKQTRLYIQSDAMDGQFPIIPKPEFRAFWGMGPLQSPPFGVIPNRQFGHDEICPE